jgi:1-acyl-sn-glycerol-3-phosphate acyltransferase
MEKILVRVYNYFAKHRTVFFVTFGVSFLLLVFFASRVKFEEDISKILPKDKKTEKLNEIFQNSKFIDKLVITVSLKDTTAQQPDSLVAYADDFAARVQNDCAPYISKINYRVDDGLIMNLFGTITDRLPIYLNEKDYATIDTLITPDKVKQTLTQDIRTLTSPAGIALKNIISNDPVGISYIGLKKLQQLQYDENFELYDSYVVTKDHKNLLMFITPAYAPNNTGKNALLFEGLDKIIDSLDTNNKNIGTSYFGAAAVSVGNALQLRKDTIFTQGITLFFLIVFLGFYFKKKRAPIVILIPVLFGALFSLAAIYFIKGSISVIALGVGSVVLGIAVNYSLHVFNHYRHTRSIEQVIRDLAMPLTVGSFTTIGGFFCLEFVASEMLKDLGLFAAFSLIGASFCSLIFLPHFLATKKEQEEHHEIEFSWIDKVSRYNPEYNKFIVTIIFLLTIFFYFKAQKVGFESDMMKMNYMSDKLKASQAKLDKINQYSLQSIYLVTEGKTLDEALANDEKVVNKIDSLKDKQVITKYSGVSSLIISDSLQRERITRWNDYWTNAKKQQLFSTLQRQGIPLGFKSAAFDKFKALLNKDFTVLDSSSLAGIRKSFLDDYITEQPGKATVVTLIKVTPQNKQQVYNTFDKDATVTVVDKQYLTNKFVQIINSDFTSIAIMSSLLVFFVLLLTYGRIELTLVSFIPMFISWIWILGLMVICNIEFNIVNIIISALIFGLGDDYSLFIMDGLLQEYRTGKKNLSSYKSSIFLSAITTVAGLGVLVFAKHPALKSIAWISIIGILCVVLMAQILIPFLFNILIKNRVEKKKFPWTFSGMVISAFAFCYFVFGCILLTIIGFVFARLNPFKKEKSKLVYHTILSKFCKSLMYIMVNVKKVIINPGHEDFRKPAIIICNHQSFLDILAIVMLEPKLILFTNKWVWNSPFFGGVVRMADYYPVEQGAQPSIELLSKKINEGYSILVFPEGTRSVDGTMKRFHKGAFYLAQELDVEILPIVIHGTGYTMTKGDFLLKDGTITLKYLPRIKPESLQFGNGYAERAKQVGKYFREEFRKLSEEIQQPRYYREQLKYNYLYKGPVLEWYMKVKVGMEKNYLPIHELLPKQGKMLDIGCGYGFMSYMLHFTSPQRGITGIDYDEDKIETANHCFSKDDTINFIAADVLAFEFEKYDAIILSDILHYLQPEQQTEVMKKCFMHLNKDGVVLIRDGNKDLKERHKGTKLTEFFSTKFFGFNKTTDTGLAFLSSSSVKELAAANNMQCKEIDQTKYTSNIIFVIKHAE